MNTGSRDTPTEEKSQRIASSDSHGHSKTAGSMGMHDHGRHSPASAHSPGVSGKLPGLHPDSSRASRGFGTPSFSTTALPGFSLDHLPFLFNPASQLLFPPFLHPNTGSLFPGVLPPNFLPPPLQPPITNLFPSPGAECEVSNSGWSGASRNTSSLGSSSSEGDVAAKIDGRTVRSSRCSPDLNLQPTSLSSSVRKIWETTVADPVCISDVDMPLSLVTRRETTSRGSSVAESGVCTGDSIARAASTETSRTPSLDGENGCHGVSENSGIQEQTVPSGGAEQPAQWPAAKATTDILQPADDAKSSASDEVWSSSTAASRSSGIALPPRKRLTRNAEELQSPGQALESTAGANSPSPATNFRSCWKKFSAKSNVSVPSLHRTFGGKPQYDCRTYFHKLAETAKAAAASKAFVAGKGKGHFYRNANKTSPRSSDQNTGSPRVTRSQSKPKKAQSPKSSPAEPPAPVRKSTRKKSFNSRFEEFDRTGGKNKKMKASTSDSNMAGSDAGKENARTVGDEAGPNAEKKAHSKNRRRGKQPSAADAEDSSSHLSSDTLQSEPDSKLNCIDNSSVPAAVTCDGSSTSTRHEDTSAEPEPSVMPESSVVLPPKFRHFKNKAATVVFDSTQPQTSSDRCLAPAAESSNCEIAAPLKTNNADSLASATQPEDAAVDDVDMKAKHSVTSSTENSVSAEISVNMPSDEVKGCHFAGGRKSLLYRCSAAADNQPVTETKASANSQNESCTSITTDLCVSQAPADESCDARPVLSSSSASELKVSSGPCEQLSDSTATEFTSAESAEKGQTGDSLHTEQTAEGLAGKLTDDVPCRSASPGVVTESTVKTVCTGVSNASSGHLTVLASDESEQSAEPASHSASAVTRRLSCDDEEPADSLNESDSQSKVPPREVADTSTVSDSRSEVCVNAETTENSDTVAIASDGVSAEPNLCPTHDSTVDVANSLSCRTKSVEPCSNTAVESTSRSSESLKRLAPDEVDIDDEAKKYRVDSVSVENSTDDISLDFTQPVGNTPNPNTTVNLISASGECDSRTSAEQTVQPPCITNATGSSAVRIRNKATPEKSKRTKANRKLKLNRSAHKAHADSRRLVVERSNSNATAFSEEAETAGTSETCEPPMLEQSLPNLADSNHKTLTNTPAAVNYAVSNSVDPVCDMNANTSSVHTSIEQKSLRISLVAVSESDWNSSRLTDSRSEDMCNASKLSNSSSAVAVFTTTTASTDRMEQFMPGCTVPDADVPTASASTVLFQESVTLENDRSKLLSQCRSVSVVIEKMQNNNSEPPQASVSKPDGKRRNRKVKHHSGGCAVATETVLDKPLVIDERPAAEAPISAPSVDDEYRFTEDNLSESLPVPVQRVSRIERKAASRKKGRSSLPARNKEVEMSPAAVSDSSSRGATSSVDSSAPSGNATAAAFTPNASQKPPSKPGSGSARSGRRKQNLKEDRDTRSLSPFMQNDNLPAPIVEASLDGHKLKLRITKFPNRSVGESAIDAKVSAPPPLFEFSDNAPEAVEDEVEAATEPPASLEVVKEHASPRRRQLKVEGVRSRFLTLHKPAGLVPSADRVKCRLVKVGRRQWMSVGGEEAEDELSSRHSDAENSPASSSIDDMIQQPTRDRLLLVSEVKTPPRRRGRPPKAKTKTDLADAKPAVSDSKRTKRRTKADRSWPEIPSLRPEPQPEGSSRPVQEDDNAVPWLDCEHSCTETQHYCVLDSSSSRTIAADIDDYRVSTPVEFMSNVDLAISDALSDCGVMLECNTLRTPHSVFFVPSELERLMEALVLDDICRQSRRHSSLTTVDPELHMVSSASVYSTHSYYNNVPVQISSPRNNSEMDLLLSQPSLRLRNCMLPVDPSDNSDYDCTFVGYEYPAQCLPDPSEPPSLLDHHQYVDEDFSLTSSSCLTDPHVYSCVDFVL